MRSTYLMESLVTWQWGRIDFGHLNFPFYSILEKHLYFTLSQGYFRLLSFEKIDNTTTNIVILQPFILLQWNRLPWAGNIAKTMTSNGKQFTVERTARDQSMQLKAAWCRPWNLSAFLKCAFVLFCLLYNKSLKQGQKLTFSGANLSDQIIFQSPDGKIGLPKSDIKIFPSQRNM